MPNYQQKQRTQTTGNKTADDNIEQGINPKP